MTFSLTSPTSTAVPKQTAAGRGPALPCLALLMMGMRWGRDVFIPSANWLVFQRKGSQHHRSVMQPDLAQLHPSGRRFISRAATRIHRFYS
ncbi:hypothetical protein AOLI_G00049360 [Acnodon oligacanthus]